MAGLCHGFTLPSCGTAVVPWSPPWCACMGQYCSGTMALDALRFVAIARRQHSHAQNASKQVTCCRGGRTRLLASSPSLRAHKRCRLQHLLLHLQMLKPNRAQPGTRAEMPTRPCATRTRGARRDGGPRGRRQKLPDAVGGLSLPRSQPRQGPGRGSVCSLSVLMQSGWIVLGSLPAHDIDPGLHCSCSSAAHWAARMHSVDR